MNQIGEGFAMTMCCFREDGKRLGQQSAILREQKPESDTSIAGGSAMAKKPRDFDAELQALMERTRKVKTQKTTQLGELVQLVGADALPFEALAGALLAALEQSKKQPEAVARWAERGQAFFQQGARRRKSTPENAAGAAPGSGGAAAASERAA